MKNVPIFPKKEANPMGLDVHPVPALGRSHCRAASAGGRQRATCLWPGGLSRSASVSLIKVDRWCCCLISYCCIM